MSDKQPAATGPRLWLWKNFVDGKPEYWAFSNPYPCHPNGDPMTLGEPCGYADFKESEQGRDDVSEADVIAAIKRARPSESATPIAHPDKEADLFVCCADGEGSHEFRICRGKEAVFAFYEEMTGRDHDDTLGSITRAFDDPDEWRNDGTALEMELYCARFYAWKVSEAEVAMPSTTRSASVPSKWIVWSHEHQGFWPANRQGYVILQGAGYFTFDEALAIVNQGNYGMGGVPEETMMPAPGRPHG